MPARRARAGAPRAPPASARGSRSGWSRGGRRAAVPAARNASSASSCALLVRGDEPDRPCAAMPRPTGCRLRRCSPAPRRRRRSRSLSSRATTRQWLAACRYACWPPRHASTAVRASSTASPTGPVRTSCTRADLRCHGVPEHGPVASRHGERAPQGLGGLVVTRPTAQDADHLDERRRVVVEPVDERAARVQAAYDRERLVARPSREEPEHHRVAQQRAFGRRLVSPARR